MKARRLATLRWEAEMRRASDRGLLTTAQAAQHMHVPPHMIKTWKTLGLISDFGGGKGHPSLFDPGELHTAPSRRLNLRLGWRGRALTNAERMANRRLSEGTPIGLPLDSPYRMLAYSCGKCSELVTCKDPRKSRPRTYYPHECYLQSGRERSAIPENRARNWRLSQKRNAGTLDTASRYGYQWTGPELEVISRSDLTARQAAAMLGRTLFAVRTQRQRLKDDPRKIKLAGVATARRARLTQTRHA